MSRKKDFPVLASVLEPPPEIPKTKAEQLMKKFLSARHMRTIAAMLNTMTPEEKLRAQQLGPENLAHADVRKRFEHTR